jgi:hypothetical protein
MFRCAEGGLMFKCGFGVETNGGLNVQRRFEGGLMFRGKHY